MKKKDSIELVTFQEKRAKARKKRARQIGGTVALVITTMGLAIGAISVFGRSEDVAAEKPIPAKEIQSSDASFKTIDSVLKGTNEKEKQNQEKARLEAEQSAKAKAEKEAEEAQKKAEEEQTEAIKKLIDDEVAKVEKAAQDELTKASSQIDSLTKSNQSLMTENDNLKKEIERLKSVQISTPQASTTTTEPTNQSTSTDLGSVDIP